MKIKAKYSLYILVILYLILIGSSCSRNTNIKKNMSGNTIVNKDINRKLIIGAAMCTTETYYLSQVAEIMKNTAQESGVTLEIKDAKWNVETQIEDLNHFLEEDVDAIILTPVNLKSLRDTLHAIQEKGIPIINLNMKVDMLSSEYITSYVGSSSTEEAVLAARMFLEALGPKGGSVAILEGSRGSDPTIFRTEGFVEELKTHPQIQIVDIVNGNWSREGARLATMDLIKNYPDIDGIYCHDSEMAMGVINAIKELGITRDIIITGIDGQNEYYQAIRDGSLYGLVTQPKEFEAKMSIYNAIQAARGGNMKAWYKDPLTVVTKDNVDDFIASNPYK